MNADIKWFCEEFLNIEYVSEESLDEWGIIHKRDYNFKNLEINCVLNQMKSHAQMTIFDMDYCLYV